MDDLLWLLPDLVVMALALAVAYFVLGVRKRLDLGMCVVAVFLFGVFGFAAWFIYFLLMGRSKKAKTGKAEG